jgi:hypothetical protein
MGIVVRMSEILRKKNRLIIHIGSPKTGSTSIQCFLRDNREKLLAHGLDYPVVDPLQESDPYSSSGNAGIVARYFLRKHEMFYAEDGEPYLEAMLRGFRESEADSVVISSEFFWIVKEENLVRFKELVSPYFDEIKIVCYLRRNDLYVESRYQQATKAGIVGLDYRDFVRERALGKGGVGFKYFPVLQKYESVFGKESILIRNFERGQMNEKDVRSDFLYLMGIREGLKEFSCKNNINEALPAHYIKVISLLNRYSSFIKDDTRVFLLRAFSTLSREKCVKFKFDSATRKWILSSFQAENRKIAERYNRQIVGEYFQYDPEEVVKGNDPGNIPSAFVSMLRCSADVLRYWFASLKEKRARVEK